MAERIEKSTKNRKKENRQRRNTHQEHFLENLRVTMRKENKIGQGTTARIITYKSIPKRDILKNEQQKRVKILPFSRVRPRIE